MFFRMRALLVAGAALGFTGVTGATATAQLLHQATMAAGDGGAGDQFGMSVAIDGDTAAIGAPDNDGGRGAVYVLVHRDGAWTRQAKLTGRDGRFGYRVALDGDTLLVGALDVVPPNRGAAYVFTRTGGAWTEQARLARNEDGNRFGSSVALQGNTAVVGAPGGDGVLGAAYVYVRSGTSWSFQTQLRPAAISPTALLGYSVALDGNIALVGAPAGDVSAGQTRGAVYAFGRAGGGWATQGSFSPGDGTSNAMFGSSVALVGTTALVGAPAQSGSGAAYFYTRGIGWTAGPRLRPDDLTAASRFGDSVAFDGDTAIVGAPQQNSQGAAYVFARAGTAWEQRQKLTAVDGATGDGLGQAVALHSPHRSLGRTDARHRRDVQPGSGLRLQRASGRVRCRTAVHVRGS